MLATVSSFLPSTISLALRVFPQGGESSIEITTDSKSTVRNKYSFSFVLEYVCFAECKLG
jgi:hypothetical protein